MSQKSSISTTLVWILMGLLIFSLGGFGISQVGGARSSVGSVNGKDISITAYSRALQQELNTLRQQTGQPITFAQAQLFQLDQQVFGRLISQRILDAEAARLGLSIGDENVRDELLNIAAFQGLDGNFDRESYGFALQNAGLNEAEFEQNLRETAATNLLQRAISTGAEMPATYAETLLAYLGETRDFTMVVLDETALATPIAPADDAALQAYYDENTDDFLRPATRDVTYAWLTPDMIMDTVEVDETALRALYDDRSDTYNQPERRLVERLIIASDQEAQASIDAIMSGAKSFDDVVEERGLSLADIDLGDVSKAELGASGEAVFDTASGQVIGPVETDLGPALFRINGILNAQITSFADALPDLREELAAERARRIIDAQINDIDDLLAGGATVEELTDETDMQLGTLSWHAGETDGIAGYEAFRALISTVSDSDFPEVTQLEDGGIFALRLDGETEARPAPFAEAKPDVAAAWMRSAISDALSAQADAFAARLANGEDIISLGMPVLSEQGISRGDFIPDVPPTLIETVFTLEIGAVETVAGEAQVVLVELDGIAEADLTDPESENLLQLLSQNVNQTLNREILEAYGTYLRLNADIDLDQNALNAVHSHLQ